MLKKALKDAEIPLRNLFANALRVTFFCIYRIIGKEQSHCLSSSFKI